MHWRNWNEAEVVGSHPKNVWCALEAWHNCAEHQKVNLDEAVSYQSIHISINPSNQQWRMLPLYYIYTPIHWPAVWLWTVYLYLYSKCTTTLLACCTCACCHCYYSTISSLVIIIIFIIYHPTSLSITNFYHSHVYITICQYILSMMRTQDWVKTELFLATSSNKLHLVYLL